MSKCKPGDLALILAGKNEGKIVSVIRRPEFLREVPAVQGKMYLFKSTNESTVPHGCYTMDCWIVEGELTTNIHSSAGYESSNYKASRGVYPDSYLKPISNPGVGDEEYSDIELKNQGKLSSEKICEAMLDDAADLFVRTVKPFR